MIRLTVSVRYRSGSEVLVRDSGPLYDIADAQRLITEIRTVLAERAGSILRGEIEVTVRCADRQFEADGDRLIGKLPVMPKRGSGRF